MKYLFVLVIMLITLNSLSAQNGWKDMGVYKETVDTTGQLSQIIATPDGKYLVHSYNPIRTKSKESIYTKMESR